MSDELDVQELIRRFGAARIAKAAGVNRTTPYSWRKIPAEHVLSIAAEVGVEPSQLRPDIFGRVSVRGAAA